MRGKWVLFDLDGTLTQSEEGICNCVLYTADRMGLPRPDADTLRKFIGPPLAWSFQEYMGMDPETAQRAITVYRERYNTLGLFENRVYPGIRFALRALKKAGAHLGVVTGKPIGPTVRILEHFGLKKWMESVVSASDNRAEKEHLIREALPGDEGEVWMVGDRRFDMEGGVAAGVHTLGVTYGYGSKEELLSSGAERIARTREPGGTPIGEKIREMLLDRENAAMTAETEALLYAASRAQHVREKIRPAVAAGRVVLCDRFLDSSVAYQGGGRQLGIDEVLAINAPAVDGTLPDMTVYLDIDHRTAMARRCAASVPDRMEMEAEAFHARVEDGYHELIARDPDRFVAVNAEKSREEIAAEIAEKVIARLMEMED